MVIVCCFGLAAVISIIISVVLALKMLIEGTPLPEGSGCFFAFIAIVAILWFVPMPEGLACFLTVAAFMALLGALLGATTDP